MSKPQPLSTTKYGLFKSVLGNRIVSKEHVARLVKEIQTNNLCMNGRINKYETPRCH